MSRGVVEIISIEVDGLTIEVERLEDGTFRKPAYLAGAEREVIGSNPNSRPNIVGIDRAVWSPRVDAPLTAPATDAACEWQGWGTALKPAWEPILVAMKPLDKGCGFAANALRWGVAGLNIDGCRIEGPKRSAGHHKVTGGLQSDKGWGTRTQADDEWVNANKGRWPPNLLLSHTPGCRCVGTRRVKGSDRPGHEGKTSTGNIFNKTPPMHSAVLHADTDGYEEVAAWECNEETCPIAMMDRQSGERPSGHLRAEVQAGPCGAHGIYGKADGSKGGHEYEASTGGASRFFPQCAWSDEDAEAMRFLYCAKASRAERERGCEELPEQDAPVAVGMPVINNGRGPEYESHGKEYERRGKARNHHPCVKPLKLMEWLCRLTMTPTGGIVLDPFLGSGTTALACKRLGRHFVGIELSAEYCAIAERRLVAEPTPLPGV